MAAWHRIRNGQPVVPPDDALDHAANFLWMLQDRLGARPARDLDVCLILHADHTFNASTFAARQVVSTRASLYAGVAAGIGALSSGLHGGANAGVMQMLLELEHEEDIEGWVRSRLDRGEVIMGFGRMVYKTGDHLSGVSENGWDSDWPQHEAGGGDPQRIEEAALAISPPRASGASAPTWTSFPHAGYYLMGIPGSVDPFAVARVAGWCTHHGGAVCRRPGRLALYRPEPSTWASTAGRWAACLATRTGAADQAVCRRAPDGGGEVLVFLDQSRKPGIHAARRSGRGTGRCADLLQGGFQAEGGPVGRCELMASTTSATVKSWPPAGSPRR